MISSVQIRKKYRPDGGATVDDSDDHDHAEPVPESGDSAHPRPPNTRKLEPLPANREQRRIVEAVQAKNDAVYGARTAGNWKKSAQLPEDLVCHLLATDKHITITAETGRELGAPEG